MGVSFASAKLLQHLVFLISQGYEADGCDQVLLNYCLLLPLGWDLGSKGWTETHEGHSWPWICLRVPPSFV